MKIVEKWFNYLDYWHCPSKKRQFLTSYFAFLKTPMVAFSVTSPVQCSSIHDLALYWKILIFRIKYKIYWTVSNVYLHIIPMRNFSRMGLAVWEKMAAIFSMIFILMLNSADFSSSMEKSKGKWRLAIASNDLIRSAL